MPQFSASVRLKCPAPSLRLFLGTPANLPKVSDPELRLEIISAPPLVTVSERIEFRITSFGFKQRAIHVYTSASETEIVEEQIEGPLRAWRHRQMFTVIHECETQLTDEIDFEPPGGMLGYLLTEERIRESLNEGITARYEALQDLVASGDLI